MHDLGDVEFVNPPGLAPPRGAYHHVAVVGGWIFVAGQVSLDPDGELVGEGDATAQARQVMTNVAAAVEECGGTVASIYRLVTYVTDRAHIPAVRTARQELFGDRSPASSLVVVAGLADPAFLVETEASAYVLDTR